MKKTLLLLIMLNIGAAGTRSFAQDMNELPLDTLTRRVSMIQSTLDVMNRIKISGYIQAQFQWADSMGQASVAGGNFAAGVDKRFLLRRGRVKVQYDAPTNDKGISTSSYVFQIDASEKGLTIKDLYAKFTDPWSGWFSVTAGMQNRPFGYEISYSSSLRESPERGRMSQTVFRNERDLGAMVTIQGPKFSNWNWIKLDAGMFNGTGGPSAGENTSDFDKYKDFIGHLSISRTNKSEKIKYGVGVSYYDGGFRLDYDTVYSVGADSAGISGFKISETKFKNRELKRKYVGGDAQVSIDWIIGITTIRAEYIQGDQPNTASTSTSPFAPVTSSGYKRKFNGAYFYFLQNIMQSPFQLILKYDWYDPNTEVKGDDIGKTVANGLKKFNATDIKYTTIGLGLAYRWDANVKLTAYYDLVKNETSKNLSGYGKDLEDNVFTLRAQVKF
jgi:hypothetical protein